MPRILIAEDEADIRELIAVSLQFSGHEVVSVADGRQAVEAAAQEPFDLILLDVRMPVMNGYEACRKMRQAELTHNTPIVFLSAKGQESEVALGHQAGATDYILKPFAPSELARRVGQLISGDR
jgi:DNA-binding response OmpR family regulator